jgi:hypothetical protein
VIPLLAAGVGIAVAVMAFAPAITSPPPGVAVGVHEANYEAEGDGGSEVTWRFRVHVAVKLDDRREFRAMLRWLAGDHFDSLRAAILTHADEMEDHRAVGILELVSQDVTRDVVMRRFRFTREYRGVPGYYLHVNFSFPITVEKFLMIPDWVRAGDYARVVEAVSPPVRGVVDSLVLENVRPRRPR